MRINNILLIKIGILITFILALSSCHMLVKKHEVNTINHKSKKALAEFYDFKLFENADLISTSTEDPEYKLNSEVLPLFIKIPNVNNSRVGQSSSKIFDCESNISLPEQYPVAYFLGGKKINNKIHFYSSHTEDTFPLKDAIPENDYNVSREEFDITFNAEDIKTINELVINFYKSLHKLCRGEIPQKINDRLVLKHNNALTHYGFIESDLEKHNIDEDNYVYVLRDDLVGKTLKIFGYYVNLNAETTAYETWNMHKGGPIDVQKYLVILYTKYAINNNILRTTELVTKNLEINKPIDQSLLEFSRASDSKIKVKDILKHSKEHHKFLQNVNDKIVPIRYYNDPALEYIKEPHKVLEKLLSKEVPVKFHKNGKTYVLTMPGKENLNLYRKGDYLTLSDNFKIDQQQEKLSVDLLRKDHPIIKGSFRRDQDIRVRFSTFDKHSKINIDHMSSFDSRCTAKGEPGEAEINDVVKHPNRKIQEIARRYFKDNRYNYSSYNLKIRCQVAARDHHPYFGTISYKMPHSSYGGINIRFHLPSIFLAKKEEPIYFIESY